MVARGIVLFCVLASAARTAAACVADGPLETSQWIFAHQRDFYVDRSDRKGVPVFLSSPLRALLEQNWKCERKEQGICAIDSEPWTDAQDGDVLDPVHFAVTASSTAAATVQMKFRFGWRDMDNPKPVSAVATLSMVRDSKSGCWLLDDLTGREGTSLKVQLSRYLTHGP